MPFKEAYLGRVENYENEEEVIPNRIKLRSYLRELFVNQERVLKTGDTFKAPKYLKRIIELKDEEKRTDEDI